MADGVRAADEGTVPVGGAPCAAGDGTRASAGEGGSVHEVAAGTAVAESADGRVARHLVRKLWAKVWKGGVTAVPDAGVDPGGGTSCEAGDGTRASVSEGGSVPEVAAKRAVDEPADGRVARHPVRKLSAKVWQGGIAGVATAVLATLLGNWAVHVAGPHTGVTTPPSASATPFASTAPTANPGHLPGRQDVSTMARGQHFYATPNFEEDQSCGRPCWLPLYESPNEDSAFVTNNWPCEYYGPNSSVPPSCVTPPLGRTRDEIANAAVKDSGDRLLVLCQTTRLDDGQAAQDIHNQIGQDSRVWDVVAVPKAYISPDSPAWGRLTQVRDMPGFYEAFAPDMWLGDTGSHGIPCK